MSNSYPQFPAGFYFGSATAAYQIEGGWDADGKGRSIWDVFVHKRGKIKNGDTGDIACDTYRDFQTDVDIIAELEMNAYRFSIAWSRVLPQGRGAVNRQGLDYYSRLVDALLAKNASPQTRALVAEVLRATNPRGFLHGVKLGMADGYDPETVAAKVTAPVLMISGNEDRVNPIDKNAAVLAKAMPRAKLEIFDGVGHLPEVEAPEKVNALLRVFFAE